MTSTVFWPLMSALLFITLLVVVWYILLSQVGK
jgi:hypothetical protein